MKNDNIKIFVPGRLCIFGEHSDWAGEYRLKNKKIEKGYAITALLQDRKSTRLNSSHVT